MDLERGARCCRRAFVAAPRTSFEARGNDIGGFEEVFCGFATILTVWGLCGGLEVRDIGMGIWFK